MSEHIGRIFGYLVLALVWGFVAFLFVGFIDWNFNVAEWGIVGRGSIAMATLAGAVYAHDTDSAR